MQLSIKSKIFISHFSLISILLLGLSYTHYSNFIESYINNVITFHKNSSSSIVRTSSLAISGQNYGNIQLPSFIEELNSNSKLLYLQITGKSDFSSKEFSAIYTKENNQMYRNIYPPNYEKVLQTKLNKLQLQLNDLFMDKVKINFLIDRIEDSIDEYKRSIELSKKSNMRYVVLLNKKSPYIDYDKNLLFLSLETNNKNSGLVSMVFDISEIVEIKEKIIKNLIYESVVSLVFAVFILNILANKIIGPLNKLSNFMTNDFRTLNPNKTPSLEQNDEIGFLSNKFKILIESMQKSQAKIEEKAYFDNLTGVYNRNKFNDLLSEELNKNNIGEYPLCIALLDIDNFKKFNDNYGHLVGDEVLIMLANSISDNIRDTDVFARWGGEEFIIMFRNTKIDDAQKLCNLFRTKIENLVHPLAGKVTVSFGVTQYQKDDTEKNVFKRSDDALYKAKADGKNCVVVLL